MVERLSWREGGRDEWLKGCHGGREGGMNGDWCFDSFLSTQDK